MIVNSKSLTAAADQIRQSGATTKPVPALDGREVSADQLDTAARILREASPTVCNGIADERPGFLEGTIQEVGNPEVLVFQMGILPGIEYRIDRAGNVLETQPA